MLTPNLSEVLCRLLPVTNPEQKCSVVSGWICGQTVVDSVHDTTRLGPHETMRRLSLRSAYRHELCLPGLSVYAVWTPRITWPNVSSSPRVTEQACFAAHPLWRSLILAPSCIFLHPDFLPCLLKTLFIKKDVHWGLVNTAKEGSFLLPVGTPLDEFRSPFSPLVSTHPVLHSLTTPAPTTSMGQVFKDCPPWVQAPLEMSKALTEGLQRSRGGCLPSAYQMKNKRASISDTYIVDDCFRHLAFYRHF